MREVYVGPEGSDDSVVDDEVCRNRLVKVSTKLNEPDIGTKPLDHTRHWFLCNLMGLRFLSEVRKLR